MKCPVCIDPDLVMSDRQGIEIDYCPKCRGVWLDRGELDKIIDRSSEGPVELRSAQPKAAPQPQQPYAPPPPQYQHPHPNPMHDSDYGKHQYRKRKSWLSELFD